MSEKPVDFRDRISQSIFSEIPPFPIPAWAMISKIGDVELIVTDSEVEALVLENNF